jgi:hypothetical protein
VREADNIIGILSVDFLVKVGFLPSHNPIGLHGMLDGFTFSFTFTFIAVSSAFLLLVSVFFSLQY